MVMGVPVVSRLIQQELKPRSVSGFETTAQVCCVVYWEPQDLLCVHLLYTMQYQSATQFKIRASYIW